MTAVPIEPPACSRDAVVGSRGAIAPSPAGPDGGGHLVVAVVVVGHLFGAHAVGVVVACRLFGDCVVVVVVGLAGRHGKKVDVVAWHHAAFSRHDLAELELELEEVEVGLQLGWRPPHVIFRSQR